MARRRLYSSRYRTPRSLRGRGMGRVNNRLIVFFSLLISSIVLGLVNSQEIGRLASQKVKRQDYVLMAEQVDRTVDGALADLGVPLDLIRRRVYLRGEGINSWEVIEKRVTVPADLPLVLCNLELTKAIKGVGGKVFQAVENPRKKSVLMDVGFGEIITQKLILTQSDSLWRRTGKIAIIIDDLGNSYDELTQELLEIAQPLTLAVIPGQEFSKRVAELAYQRGHEVIVHLPMEPKDYPKEDPGQGAILVRLSGEEIGKRVEKALKSVPHARGINNHMGSRATEDKRVMGEVLRRIYSKGLYFVDSRTSSYSIAYKLAQEMGVKAAEIQVPLDNIPEEELIKKRVEEMVQVAMEQGVVLARGHVQYPQTLLVLKQTLPALEKRGFQFVYVSEIVK